MLTEYLGHEHGGTPIEANMRNGTHDTGIRTETNPMIDWVINTLEQQ